MNLSDIVARFPSLRIGVVGDRLLDVYHFGRISRLSPEAPCPIFIEDRIEERPGGAANVTANLAAMGCKTWSYYGASPVTEKHRWLANHYQVFRQDFDHIQQPKDNVGFFLRSPPIDAVVLSDYGKGMLRGRICEGIITEARHRGIPVIVDPRGESWSKFDGATCICPNELEFKSLRVSAPDTDIIEKKGEHGIQIHLRGNRLGPLIPARARSVFDVTGCGDVVVACVAAVLAAGGDLTQAATIGNIAAGWAAGQLGTVAVPCEILKELIACESSSVPGSLTVSTKATAAS